MWKQYVPRDPFFLKHSNTHCIPQDDEATFLIENATTKFDLSYVFEIAGYNALDPDSEGKKTLKNYTTPPCHKMGNSQFCCKHFTSIYVLNTTYSTDSKAFYFSMYLFFSSAATGKYQIHPLYDWRQLLFHQCFMGSAEYYTR